MRALAGKFGRRLLIPVAVLVSQDETPATARTFGLD
jgi:hypothetical protein